MSSIQRIVVFNKSLLNNYIINQAHNRLKYQLYSSYTNNYEQGKYKNYGLSKARDSFRSKKQPYNQSKYNNSLTSTTHKSENRVYEKRPEIPRELIDRDDPDRFGTLSGVKLFTDKFDADEGDKREEEHEEIPRRPLRTKQYADMIKEHLKNNRIKEALDVLELKMIKEDRVKPENYIYNLLIGGCARVGYTKKAFKLFNDMKKRGLQITGGTYTSLFNACSNSPWPEDGLKRATHLRELMFEKGYIANITNYNAMIKAFGRCGDLKTAFMLVDEMIDQKLLITSGTFNFLLQACISDKEAGFRHALLTWRKIWQLKKKPNTYSYNLMLRCIRDCGLGDMETATEFFESFPKKPEQIKNTGNNQLMLEAPEQQNNDPTTSTALQTVIHTEAIPNLLSKTPHLGSVIAIKDITKPEDRLLLLGGASGLLKQMYEDKAMPDIKTYTQLLQVLPPTNSAEIALMRMMRKTGDKVDVCFLNMLMKRRCERFEYDSAKEVMTMIKAAGLRPDILTYGVLAMTCKTKFYARDMLDEMSDAGYRPNSEILGTMLHRACKDISFGYVFLVMETLLEEGIKPNSVFLGCLEIFYQKCFKYNSAFSTTGHCEELSHIETGYFVALFKKFEERYGLWIQEIREKYPEIQKHPWEQFQKESEEGFEERKTFERKRKIKKRFLRAIS